ncbi:FAD-dependent oxidoreductase [Clostridium sp. 'deep sea']|uniref:FAD-dependent oxidoreductase n=1 Tax=Clostridium sp. 'deep sea' TaxID=2779445 RepID=UPI001896407D|nr:FAD-dependent oxidoreductase [Clostridium sp. 'deep sea']QOR34316.1 FAD-dependent oxidoreductase [Clostridium sp. 'deep sea']
MSKVYDVAIVGGGPGGLTAALYASRSKLSTVVLEKGQVGGQAATTEEIENWPGTIHTTGPALTAAMAEHAKKFGAEFVREDVVGIETEGFVKTIKGRKGEYKTKSIIISTGAEPRVLGIPGEREFRGKGVSYCATCDADFYEELDVVVLGNGDAAIEEAMYLTKFAETVTIVVIHEEGKVDATPVVAERAFKNDKLKWIWNSTISEIGGDGIVEWVKVKNINTGEVNDVATNGVFVFVGTVPRTQAFEGVLEMDQRGYLMVDPQTMASNKDGVFAVGDCRQKYLRQVVTAAGDGATAATVAEKYIHEEENFLEDVIEVDVPVLVAFWSPASEASMAAMPKIEGAVEELGDSVKLVKIDTYRNQRISNRYNITNIPTIVLFNKGKVVETINSEAIDTAALVAKVKSL